MSRSWLVSRIRTSRSRSRPQARLVRQPRSATRPTRRPRGSSTTRPTGSRASCGSANGSTRNPATSRGSPERINTADRATSSRSRIPARVPSVAWSGTLNFFAKPSAPLQWSWCSWVRTSASIPEGSNPRSFIRRAISREENPASISNRWLPDSTTTALPPLPEPRMPTRRSGPGGRGGSRGCGAASGAGSGTGAAGGARASPKSRNPCCEALSGRRRFPRCLKGETTARERVPHPFPPLELVFLPRLQELQVGIAELLDLHLDALDARGLQVVEEDRDLLLQLAQLDLQRARRQVERHVGDLLERVVEAGVDADGPQVGRPVGDLPEALGRAGVARPEDGGAVLLD